MVEPKMKRKKEEIAEEKMDPDAQISIRFLGENGNELGGSGIVIPVGISVENLQQLCNQLLDTGDDPLPISFFTEDGVEIRESINQSLEKVDQEKVLTLVYAPQAVFRIYPVTRCSSSIPGHGEPIISAQFSPDGNGLASGSGDCTLRIWDTQTELPLYTCKGHKNHVLCVSWSPNAEKIASACRNGQIMLWNPKNGEQIGKTLTGHKQWITSLAWEPLHKDSTSRHLASAGKDGNIRIWDTVKGLTVRTLSGHTASVTCLRWGGQGLIYTGSQDRTVKVWRADDGVMCRNLTGHAHWINTLALNTDYVLRTSCFDPANHCAKPEDDKKAQEIADRRYNEVLRICGGERLVSGSDDFTMFLWNPSESKQHIARLTGHQQLVNQVVFSPDTRTVASASFDKSIKLWCGRTGKYLSSLRGHVQAVYQIAWSADSRLLVSGSADSTLKIWDIRSKRLMFDLPGHGDEVYTVDWSPEGTKVVSGGKDKVLKLWRQ
ncbi:unnamed protein product, partial [Mesorhabditis belari]|uniref:NLE domain-containing protein n=1 Tax=Mesorhabditis belari TaxID=2138241 RepID=A0AAF3FJ21_9BILA